MKTQLIILYIFWTPLFLLAQEHLIDRAFFSVKVTPTSLIGLNTPTLMGGVEIWPAKNVNFQFEYGHQVAKRKLVWSANRNSDLFYQKYKFGVRYHFYKNFDGPGIWNSLRRRGRRILPVDRRSFIGVDIMSVPQSYIKTSGRVLLSDGMPLTFTQAKINRNAIVAAVVSGCQIYHGKSFFIELYAGFGLKWMKVDIEIDPSLPLPLPIQNSNEVVFFSDDETNGLKTMYYGDLGIKLGFQLLHK